MDYLDRLRWKANGSDVPQNELAEAIVLWHLLIHPDWIDSHPTIGTLLWHSGHQRIWQAIQSVPERRPGHFELAVHAELRRRWPRQGERYVDLLEYVVEDWYAWEHAQYERARERGEPVMAHGFHHSFDWWLERLQECAEARRLVDLAWHRIEAIQRVDYYRHVPEAHVEDAPLPPKGLIGSILDLD